MLSILDLVYSFPYFDLYFVGRPVEIASAFGCAIVRLMSGEFCAKGLEQCKRPEKPLKLYEFEACPYCKKVREALCVLDLEVEIYPCPKPGDLGTVAASRFRGRVEKETGKTKFPVLDDGGTLIRGSETIVSHLWGKYGDKATPPLNYRMARVLDQTPALFFPTVLRLLPRHGIYRTPSREPSKLLILHGFEPSPFVKVVRETLCSMELPYTLVPMPHGSLKRVGWVEKYGEGMHQASFRKSAGVIQVPMLIDPNGTNKPIFESADIIKYLKETYGAKEEKAE